MLERIYGFRIGKSTGILAVLFLSALFVGICMAGRIPFQVLQPILAEKPEGNFSALLFWRRFLFHACILLVLMRLMCGNLFRRITAAAVSFRLLLQAGYALGVWLRLCEVYPLDILVFWFGVRWLICLCYLLWMYQRRIWSMGCLSCVPICLFFDLGTAFILA